MTLTHVYRRENQLTILNDPAHLSPKLSHQSQSHTFPECEQVLCAPVLPPVAPCCRPTAPLVLGLDATPSRLTTNAGPAPSQLPPCHCKNAPVAPPSCCQRQTGRQGTPGLCCHGYNYNATFCRCLCCFPSCRRCQVGRQRTPGLRHCRSTMPPSSPDEGPRVHSNDRLPKLLTPSFFTAPSRPSDSVCRSPSSIGAREVNCACSFCACFVHVDLHAQNFC